MTRPRLSHLELLEEQCAFTGQRVADLGCGTGAFARALAKRGALVVALDPQAGLLTSAPAVLPVAAVAEALPLANSSLNLCLFFNALHHLPLSVMAQGLAECARVLKPAGRLGVIEPIAEGAHFELLRPLEDETAVRAAALASLRQAVASGLWRLSFETEYETTLNFVDFAAWRKVILAADPARGPAFAAMETRLAAGFQASAERTAEGFAFYQPSRFTLLELA